MKEKASFWQRLLGACKKIGSFFYKKVILGIYRLLKKIILFFYRFLANIYLSAKHHPKAFMKGFSSGAVMGLGQLRNKQWYKAIFFFSFFLIFFIAEFATGSYGQAFGGELAEYPAGEGVLYFFRDYGGFFTRGIWGFLTLGKLVLGDIYRGQTITLADYNLIWRSADSSQLLLGEGIIALVFFLMLVVAWYTGIKDAYHSQLKLEETGKTENAKRFLRRIWTDYFAYIIIIPSFILILLFTLVPFLFSFLIAFTNWTSRIRPGEHLIEWVGLETFKTVFSSADWLKFFVDVFLWTIVYAFMSSVTVYVLGLIQALIIESKYVKFKKVWRAILILPWAIPGMISLMLFRNVFADNFGLINQLLANAGITEQVKEFLRSLGLLNQTGVGNISWFTSPLNGNLGKVLIIVVNLWLGYPYFMMLITGVLGTIPDSLYEAAEIDGASNMQKFRFITFPWILRATAPVIITTFTFNFNNFGAIYFLSGGGPAYPLDEIPVSVRIISAAPGQTDILISWIYKLSFTAIRQQYNLASVYSILIFLLIGMVAIYNLSRIKSFWEED